MNRIIKVNTTAFNQNKDYEIHISDSYDNFPDLLSQNGFSGRKAVIVTDSHVCPLYAGQISRLLDNAGFTHKIYSFPAGENHKTLQELMGLYRFLIDNNIDRTGFLMALGGGVVGDMTGYVAATYLRGIDFVQMPTTLLSMVDSSIGGKTGVDFDGYKNMLGAFHMPSLVYINTSVLTSLDLRQFSSGMAEIIKHGLIKDSSYYSSLYDNRNLILSNDISTLTAMIAESCIIKKNVVEKDPTEKGERALLNFGHTLGHAIEKYRNFELLHGECVALGILASMYISYKKGFIGIDDINKAKDIMKTFNINTSIKLENKDEVVRYTKSDKKMSGSKIKYIILRSVGNAVIDMNITDEDMYYALDMIAGE